jgi:hypothetical protein
LSVDRVSSEGVACHANLANAFVSEKAVESISSAYRENLKAL